jgi:hypothetical protein
MCLCHNASNVDLLLYLLPSKFIQMSRLSLKFYDWTNDTGHNSQVVKTLKEFYIKEPRESLDFDN